MSKSYLPINVLSYDKSLWRLMSILLPWVLINKTQELDYHVGVYKHLTTVNYFIERTEN
jgi:hypothetical protein